MCVSGSIFPLQVATSRNGSPYPWTHSQAIVTGTGGVTQGTEGTGGVVVGVGSAQPTIMAGGGAEVGLECTKLPVEVCVCVRACVRAYVRTYQVTNMYIRTVYLCAPPFSLLYIYTYTWLHTSP